MGKEDVFAILKSSISHTIKGIDENKITLTASLRDLGANSMDRAEIIMTTLEKLSIRALMSDFANCKNIEKLCEVLCSKLK